MYMKSLVSLAVLGAMSAVATLKAEKYTLTHFPAFKD